MKLVSASTEVEIQMMIMLCQSSRWIGNAYSMSSRYSGPNIKKEI